MADFIFVCLYLTLRFFIFLDIFQTSYHFFITYQLPYPKFSYPYAITRILFLIYGIFLKDGLVNQIIHK